MTESLIDSPDRAAEGTRIFNFRHSMAQYQAYDSKVKSDNPRGGVDIEAQPLTDLTPEGVEYARSQAHKFFDLLDPKRDVFYIVSSDQTRALQTAAIYARVAIEHGFNVARHQKTGTEIADKIGGGYVRSIETLSINYGDAVSDAVFNPQKTLPEINWSAVDSNVKEAWDKAREVILADDQGSWGANYYKHSATIKQFLPDIHTAQEVAEGQYKNLLRLAEFAKKKSGNERVNVLSFGHENYMGVPLEKDTGNHALPNCEGVELRDGKLVRVSL